MNMVMRIQSSSYTLWLRETRETNAVLEFRRKRLRGRRGRRGRRGCRDRHGCRRNAPSDSSAPLQTYSYARCRSLWQKKGA